MLNTMLLETTHELKCSIDSLGCLSDILTSNTELREDIESLVKKLQQEYEVTVSDLSFKK